MDQELLNGQRMQLKKKEIQGLFFFGGGNINADSQVVFEPQTEFNFFHFRNL